MTMRIGPLRHHLLIQDDQGLTPDNFGAVAPNWVTLASRFADIQPIAGMEKWQGHQVRPDVTHGITMRYYPLKDTMRLVWGSRIFNVASALNPNERQRGTQMNVMAIEEV